MVHFVGSISSLHFLLFYLFVDLNIIMYTSLAIKTAWSALEYDM